MCPQPLKQQIFPLEQPPADLFLFIVAADVHSSTHVPSCPGLSPGHSVPTYKYKGRNKRWDSGRVQNRAGIQDQKSMSGNTPNTLILVTISIVCEWI